MKDNTIYEIADIIIKQANEDCYQPVEFESIVSDWVRFFMKKDFDFNYNKFESYIFENIEGYVK